MIKFFKHFIDLVKEVKKLNIYLSENNSIAKQLLERQKETNDKLDRVANLEGEFLSTLTHFVAIREKQMAEEAKREQTREQETKPTKYDYLF